MNRIVGLVCTVPQWWTATAMLWNSVPPNVPAKAANS